VDSRDPPGCAQIVDMDEAIRKRQEDLMRQAILTKRKDDEKRRDVIAQRRVASLRKEIAAKQEGHQPPDRPFFRH
jgi:hypothetical protein